MVALMLTNVIWIPLKEMLAGTVSLTAYQNNKPDVDLGNGYESLNG